MKEESLSENKKEISSPFHQKRQNEQKEREAAKQRNKVNKDGVSYELKSSGKVIKIVKKKNGNEYRSFAFHKDKYPEEFEQIKKQGLLKA